MSSPELVCGDCGRELAPPHHPCWCAAFRRAAEAVAVVRVQAREAAAAFARKGDAQSQLLYDRVSVVLRDAQEAILEEVEQDPAKILEAVTR